MIGSKGVLKMETNAFVLTFTVCFSTVIVTVLGKIVNILLFILHLFLRQFFFTRTEICFPM